MYTDVTAGYSRSCLPMEAQMPRFVGKRGASVWVDIGALIVLVVVVVVVLALAGVIHVFGS